MRRVILNMSPTDHETEVVPPAEEPEDMPLPSDPKVIFLGGLFILAFLAAAYVASDIVLPLVFAIILKLLLQPASRMLERLQSVFSALPRRPHDFPSSRPQSSPRASAERHWTVADMSAHLRRTPG
jgi:hypothetical protein